MSRHVSPRGGFVFRFAHDCLSSPGCSCISTTLPCPRLTSLHAVLFSVTRFLWVSVDLG